MNTYNGKFCYRFFYQEAEASVHSGYRRKGEFYLDVISQFDVNCQMAVGGLGTAHSEMLELLGLEPHKAVILSAVREDKMNEVMNCLEDKFATIKNGKGIAFSLPVSDVAGLVQQEDPEKQQK